MCKVALSNHLVHFDTIPDLICMSMNMVPTAASYYKATLSVTTGLSANFSNLTIIYKQQV